jgi:transcriptional regulator with XRE-family HTH domain
MGEAMGERPITPSALALELDVDLGTVSRWRRGIVPSDTNLGRLATALRVTFKWLKSGEGAKDVVRPLTDATTAGAVARAMFERGFSEGYRTGWRDALQAGRDGPEGASPTPPPRDAAAEQSSAILDDVARAAQGPGAGKRSA